MEGYLHRFLFLFLMKCWKYGKTDNEWVRNEAKTGSSEPYCDLLKTETMEDGKMPTAQ